MSDWRDVCPGTNAGYESGKTFYTLKTQSGLFLCHPKMYHDSIPPKEHRATWNTPPGRSEGGLTKHALCAWVTYSLDDLRKVYTYLSTKRKELKDGPTIPWVGQFALNENNMGIIQNFRPLTVEEKRASKAAARTQSTTVEPTKRTDRTDRTEEHHRRKLEQEQDPIIPSYVGAGLVNAMLPSVDLDNKPKQQREPTREPEQQPRAASTTKGRLAAWKKKRAAGGVMNYILPAGPNKKE